MDLVSEEKCCDVAHELCVMWNNAAIGKKMKWHICSHFSTVDGEEGWRGFGEFGGVRTIWTKLKLPLTSNWLWFRILGAQTSICVCWLHALLLGWWGLGFLFESCAWFNLLLLCGAIINFLPCGKWVPLAQDEEEDEDGNGQLGLSNGKNNLKDTLKERHDTLNKNYHCTIMFIDMYLFCYATSVPY